MGKVGRSTKHSTKAATAAVPEVTAWELERKALEREREREAVEESLHGITNAKDRRRARLAAAAAAHETSRTSVAAGKASIGNSDLFAALEEALPVLGERPMLAPKPTLFLTKPTARKRGAATDVAAIAQFTAIANSATLRSNPLELIRAQIMATTVKAKMPVNK